MKPRATTKLLLVLGITIVLLAGRSFAATFSGNARVEVADSNGGLSWNGSALSVACWFRISVPSSTNLTENMTILVNRRTGNDSSAYAYLIQFNISSGNVEFTSSTGAPVTRTLIERPYLDRWYHVAVTRDAGGNFVGYVDGRPVFTGSGAAGNSTDGVSIGGWNASGGAGRYFFGDIQEVAIHQSVLSPPQVRAFMFSDLPVTNLAATLRGYFKLAYSTNSTNLYRNFALNSPVGTAEGQPFGPGSVQFEETDLAGEQSLFDSRKNGAAQALVPLSGGFAWQQTALARPTPGVAFDWRFGYSSANTASGVKLGDFDPFEAQDLGRGWRHSFEARILPEGGVSEVRLLQWDGSIETWLQTTNDASGAHYRTRHREYRGELLRLVNGEFEWTTPERLVHHFRNPFPSEFDPPPDDPFLLKKGFLEAIRDFNGNSVEVSRDVLGKIDSVVDSARGTYVFSYTNNLIATVTFGPWVTRFTYDDPNRLVSKSITNTSGFYASVNTTWQFAYGTNASTSNLLERIIDPRGNTNLFVQYDRYGRKTNELDALGRGSQTRYGVPGKRQITRLDPATNSWIETYDRKGRILAQRDPLLNETSYTYDDAGNRTRSTEPLGWKTFFGYDSRANVIARTNALAEVTRWNFHPFFNKATNEINPLNWTNSYVLDHATGNLLRHFDDLGTLVSYTYRTNGLVDTAIDANGHTNRFFYDTNGFLIRKLDAAGFPTAFGYNDVGWKTSATNALNQRTIFEHDLNGQVVRTVDPLQRELRRTFDPNGNVTSEYDAKNNFTSNIFDLANQRITTTDRTRTNTTSFFYNSRGKLERVTDPLNNSATNFYDNANRLTKTTDPLGQSVRHEYDANGNETAMIDKVNQRWTKTYDRLNRVTAESNPQGDKRRTTFDVVGRIQQVFTPLGHPSTHAYDGRGRLTNWVDAENFAWRYDYDGNANITNITDALGGRYVMAYSNRNERVFEQNQDTNIWRYAYDELLRLKVQRDPNGTTRTLSYEAGGRLRYVYFNTGRMNSLSYDENNNPTELERVQFVDGEASSVISTLDYDAMDRLTRYSDDVTSRAVLYGRDDLGRPTRVTYPGGKILTQQFDANSRLTGQVFQFDATRSFTNSYAYDSADRMVGRTYPNGVVQSNSFDTAGRITGLSHSAVGNQPSAINVALTYAYDRNGNKTAATEKGVLDWTPPPLTDEIANYTAAGKLKTRSIHTNAPGVLPSPGGEGQGEGGLWNYKYDLSGNMTNASLTGAAAQSWALTYDEDNRTTSLRWTTNAQATTVSNRYDALGRRVSRTLNGGRTDYVLDVSGGMERILCDVDSTGTITAWYVHGSDLAFKVSPDGTLTCYHADAQANIIALSGTNGTLLAQYAFTPYGRTLGSSNLQSAISNPYLFVGSQGVMEELPGLYFMRARYYSAEAGVFLSTDPVKKIGPGWQAVAYPYAGGNPMSYHDADGLFFKAFISKAKTVIAKVSAAIAKVSTTAKPNGKPQAVGGGSVAPQTSSQNLKTISSSQPLNSGGSKVNNVVQKALNFGGGSGRDPVVDRLSMGAFSHMAKQAAEKYVFENNLVDFLHKHGDPRAGENAIKAQSVVRKAMPLVDVIKGGYDEFGNRGYSLGQVADAWRWKNIKASVGFARENPDQAITSLREGVDSATAVSINVGAGILSGGWVDPDFSGEEIGDFTEWLATPFTH